MVCLSRPYHLNFFKGCLPQILLGTFLNTLSRIFLSSDTLYIYSTSNGNLLYYMMEGECFFSQERCKYKMDVTFSNNIWNLELYSFQSSVAFHTETSHLICSASQMTVFYMECNIGLKWVNLSASLTKTFSPKLNLLSHV